MLPVELRRDAYSGIGRTWHHGVADPARLTGVEGDGRLHTAMCRTGLPRSSPATTQSCWPARRAIRAQRCLTGRTDRQEHALAW